MVIFSCLSVLLFVRIKFINSSLSENRDDLFNVFVSGHSDSSLLLKRIS